MKKFRIQGKHFFLTFPKVNTTQPLEYFKKTIIEKEINLKYLIISKELHKSKENHYHILLSFYKRKNITKVAVSYTHLTLPTIYSV